MKKHLALQLLSELLEWDTNESTTEFEWLRMMVDAKFDHYQGYTPGERFYVHFIHWLQQFGSKQERRVAYDFVKERLIFVSQREMYHLVSLTLPIVQRATRRAVARELGLKVHQTWTNAHATREIQTTELRTLYVGLSDGARIDVFRRENEGAVSNEQVVASSEITAKKWEGLSAELRKSLDARGHTLAQATFKRICLIDDFTASGSTFVRFENDEWSGKLHRFCDQNAQHIGKHIDEHATVHVHHYLATQKAASAIRDLVATYGKAMSSLLFETTFSNTLAPEVVIDEASDPSLVSLIYKYYDASIETNTHLKGDVRFGYRQCGLPVVLDHNSPNNSIALLWARGEESNLMRPLFPRKQRHVEHGQSI